MGIFSSESEYYAFGQATPLLDDEDKKDTLSTFVLSALIHDEENIADNIVAAASAGLPKMVDRYHQYGKSRYVFGLPESNFTSQEIDSARVQDVLGPTKELVSLFGMKEEAFLASVRHLRTTTWWDINKRTSVYDADPSFLQIYGAYPTIGDPTDFYVRRRVTYIGGDPVPTNQLQIVFEITGWDRPTNPGTLPTEFTVLTTFDQSVDYLEGIWVIYHLTSEVGQPTPPGHDPNNYWPTRYEEIYYIPSAEFPESIVNTRSKEFLPIAVFLYDNINYYADPNWRATLQGLLRRLNMDADEIWQEFVKAVRENPIDDAKLYDFLIGFFVQLFGTYDEKENPGLVRYIGLFFEDLYSSRRGDRLSYEAYLADLATWEKENNTQQPTDDGSDYFPISTGNEPVPPKIEMGVSEGYGVFIYHLQWSFIEKYTSKISYDDAQSGFVPLSGMGPGHYGHWVNYTRRDFTGELIYTSFYVMNLENRYVVNSPDGARGARMDGPIRCPINKEILDELNFREREELLQEGLGSLVFVLVEQELKWYQSTFWQGIFTIVTIALTATIISVGWQGVISALGIGATGFAYTLLSWTVKFAVGALVQVSASIAFQDQFLVTIISVATGFLFTPNGLIAGTNQFFANFATGTISEIFQAFMKAGSAVFQLYNAYSSSSVDFEDFTTDPTKTHNERMQELEDQYYGMSGSLADPHLEISRRLRGNPGESPDQFYYRVLQTNPGQDVVEATSRFVDIALRLPRTPSETLTSYTSSERYM